MGIVYCFFDDGCVWVQRVNHCIICMDICGGTTKQKHGIKNIEGLSNTTDWYCSLITVGTAPLTLIIVHMLSKNYNHEIKTIVVGHLRRECTFNVIQIQFVLVAMWLYI